MSKYFVVYTEYSTEQFSFSIYANTSRQWA
jgi:hypothetical protein